ncbi:TSUP family transporter [Massilia sp. B-10]|nr:TSUP family transporter [Massilia sp. B-10]
MVDFALLGGAAFLAGLVDAVVGGGGLIQLPVLFSFFPREALNDAARHQQAGLSIFGTSAAAVNYARRVRVAWSAAAPAAFAAFALSFAGAYTVTKVPADFVRLLLPVVLLAVAVYTFRKKDFGSVHAPVHSGNAERYFAIGMGACIGFYDGFFGPGTGSFLIFLFVRFFGFDFLSASAAAKVVNVACNFSALMWFGVSGHLLWQLGLLMAACQVAGSLVGTRLAIKHGSAFVRKLFLVVVSLLILKTSYDAILKWQA